MRSSSEVMMTARRSLWGRAAAYTLFELLLVLAIGALLAIGLAMHGATDVGMQRRIAGERVMRWVESARREAVVRARPVMLGIRPTGGEAIDVSACKAGLFLLDEWPQRTDRHVVANRLSSWWMLDRGVLLDPTADTELLNPLAVDAIEVFDENGQSVFVSSLVFDAYGRLVHPVGSEPVGILMRVARWDVTHRSWRPVDGKGEGEECIRIGRGGGKPIMMSQ